MAHLNQYSQSQSEQQLLRHRQPGHYNDLLSAFRPARVYERLPSVGAGLLVHQANRSRLLDQRKEFYHEPLENYLFQGRLSYLEVVVKVFCLILGASSSCVM